MANQQAKKSGNSAKIGRAKRRPSNANQPLRSAKNKRLRIEREARKQAYFAERVLKHPRGQARRTRRWGMSRTVGA